jgi:hypothetical protein
LFFPRFPASAGDTHAASCLSLTKFLTLAVLVGMTSVFATDALAQKAGGGNRAAKVGLATVETEILANFTDVQARVVAAPAEAVTASTNAVVEIQKLQLGDMVRPGDIIARQDREKLELRLVQLQAKYGETRVRLADSEDDLVAETGLLEIAKEQATLLEGKARRARELVANNALPVDAAETALNASLTAKLQVLTRQASIARKKANLKVAQLTLSQLEFEVAQVKDDIKATELRARSAGQIVFLADYQRGYAREGEVIAKIMDLARFEIEAEIPIDFLPFVSETKAIRGRALDNEMVDVALRVALPQQNLRTATRTMRFTPKAGLPETMRAANAVVVLQIPVSSPKPQVIVPKDAVLPVTGGHMVFVADGDTARRRIIQLGSAVENGFIVKSGLDAGQQVVVRGNEQLSDGKKIEVGGKGGGGKPDGKKGDGDKKGNKKTDKSDEGTAAKGGAN